MLLGLLISMLVRMYGLKLDEKAFTDIPHDANGDLSFTMFGDMYFGTSVSPTAAELGGTGQIRNAYLENILIEM